MISLLWGACLMSLLQAGSDGLDAARVLIRQGQLTVAEQRLTTLGTLSDTGAEASRVLLLGNIAYERGHYDRARDGYLESLELLGSIGVVAGDSRADAAHMNMDMATSRLTRQAALDAEASRLRLAVSLLLLIAGLVVLGLHRISRPKLASLP